MKISLFFNFLLAVLLFTGTACEKLQGEGRTVVEGKVIGKSTGNPIPFAKLVIRSQPGNLAAGFNTKEFEKEADAQGKFDFSFEADGDKNYALLGYKEQRFYSGSGSEDMLAIAGARRNTNLKLKLKSFAWAKIKFVNEPPLDTAWFYVYGTYFHADEAGDIGFYLNMLHKDTIITRPLEGDAQGDLIYRMNKRGVITRNVFPFLATGLDTTNFEIKY